MTSYGNQAFSEKSQLVSSTYKRVPFEVEYVSVSSESDDRSQSADARVEMAIKQYAAKTFWIVVLIFASTIAAGFLIMHMYNAVELSSSQQELTVVYDQHAGVHKVIDNTPIFKADKHEDIVLASGTYTRNFKNHGWNYLSIAAANVTSFAHHIQHTADKHHIDPKKLTTQVYFRSMKALGFLEGYLSCHEMQQWYVNFYSGLFDGGDPTDEALQYLELNHEWMEEQAELLWSTSDYWTVVNGQLSQLNGLLAGASAACPGSGGASSSSSTSNSVYLPSMTKSITMIHLLLMNANGGKNSASSY